MDTFATNLSSQIETFSEQNAQLHCFAHIVNLVAKVCDLILYMKYIQFYFLGIHFIFLQEDKKAGKNWYCSRCTD